MFYTVTAIDLFNFYFEVLDIFLINLLTSFFMLILNKDFSFKLLIFFLIPTFNLQYLFTSLSVTMPYFTEMSESYISFKTID